MVFRLSPVTALTRCTPPRPHCIDKTPANRRRLFSFRPAITRLMAWCSRANALRGCNWHSSQAHRWTDSSRSLVTVAHPAGMSETYQARLSLHRNRQVIYGQTLSVDLPIGAAILGKRAGATTTALVNKTRLLPVRIVSLA
jgi:hypothetical protein